MSNHKEWMHTLLLQDMWSRRGARKEPGMDIMIDISPIIIPGVIGAFLCALEHPYAANVVWCFSNLIMSIRSYLMGDFTNATSYAIFQLFALFGVIRHIIDSRKLKVENVQ